MIITHELPTHVGAIEALLDTSFGPKRHAKTVYKLRRGVPHLADLSFVALDDDGMGGQKLVATIRYWPVLIGGAVAAVMLGPIAIDPAYRSAGLGSRLIRHSLEQAKALGHRICILVGDAAYYTRFGFSRAMAAGLSLPGPVDLDRFLAIELADGAMAGLTGMVGRAVTRTAMPRTAMPRTAVARTGLRAVAHGSLTRKAGRIAAPAQGAAVSAPVPAQPSAVPAAPATVAGQVVPMPEPALVIRLLEPAPVAGLLPPTTGIHGAEGGRRRLRRAAR